MFGRHGGGGGRVGVSECHETADDLLPGDCLDIRIRDAEKVLIEVLHVSKTAEVDGVLEYLADPEYGEEPEQEGRKGRHLADAPGYENLGHGFAMRHSSVVDAAGEKGSKPDYKRQGSTAVNMCLPWIYI